jgi:alpha-beta hydrolase superfamily lysophospholipase
VLTLFLLLLLAPALARAEEALVPLATRPGVTLPVYCMRSPGSVATLLLISGGTGGMGKLKDGQPTSLNFLVRSREAFAQAGFDVAILGIPSDQSDLPGGSYRMSQAHMQDLQSVVRQLKGQSGLPVWIVGTSMGTISATAAAIALGPEDLAGVVLTSSITDKHKAGAVLQQDLPAIRIPLLVVHHALDSCKFCVPNEAARIVDKAVNAPLKKFVLAEGGSASLGAGLGDNCGPLAHHGYLGMEQEAVRLITDWIRHPQP